MIQLQPQLEATNVFNTTDGNFTEVSMLRARVSELEQHIDNLRDNESRNIANRDKTIDVFRRKCEETCRKLDEFQGLDNKFCEVSHKNSHLENENEALAREVSRARAVIEMLNNADASSKKDEEVAQLKREVMRSREENMRVGSLDMLDRRSRVVRVVRSPARSLSPVGMRGRGQQVVLPTQQVHMKVNAGLLNGTNPLNLIVPNRQLHASSSAAVFPHRFVTNAPNMAVNNGPAFDFGVPSIMAVPKPAIAPMMTAPVAQIPVATQMPTFAQVPVAAPMVPVAVPVMQRSVSPLRVVRNAPVQQVLEVVPSKQLAYRTVPGVVISPLSRNATMSFGRM
jgi:hypothetical protein